jgi:hypothetical protein
MDGDKKKQTKVRRPTIFGEPPIKYFWRSFRSKKFGAVFRFNFSRSLSGDTANEWMNSNN